MSTKIHDFERLSGIELYGLGLDREKWQAALQRYTTLVVQESIFLFGKTRTEPSLEKYILDNLGIDTKD